MLKSARVSVFCDFLLRTFGVETMRRCGVYDIAGGKGDIAFNLQVASYACPFRAQRPRCDAYHLHDSKSPLTQVGHGVPSVLVDPLIRRGRNRLTSKEQPLRPLCLFVL